MPIIYQSKAEKETNYVGFGVAGQCCSESTSVEGRERIGAGEQHGRKR